MAAEASFDEVQGISPSNISFTRGLMYVCKRLENWVNHKMDAPSAAIAKVVVVHVLQTRLHMHLRMYSSSLLHYLELWLRTKRQTPFHP